MKRPLCILFSLLLISVTHLSWSQSPKVKNGPKKPWIENINFDMQAVPPAGQESGHYYLLLDEQENCTQQEDFTHYAYKILTNEGVQQMSDLSFDFDPSYEELVFHAISIHRDGAVIDQLPKQIRVIQREQSMDRHLYDGSQTAIINMTDVRVGDVVEYAMTRKGYNPIYAGHINRKIYFNYGFAFEKCFKKLIALTSHNLTFKNVNTTIEPVTKKEGDKIAYTWTTGSTPALETDNHEPDWYNPYQHVMISDFESWADVAVWASKHYNLNDQEKEAVTKEIASQFNDATPEKYALEAIRFVQDKIRYLGFESGLNSHQPHAPLKVYNQRFGDCKDKSWLLATLLQIKGIEANPVLLNTSYRDKISEQLPSANAFDHCVVQIKLNDNTFYIDPTINDQGGELNNNYFPPYGKGLVVNTNTKDLVEIPKPKSSSILEKQTFDIDSIGGGGMLKVKTVYTGAEADNQRSFFSRNNLDGVQKNYLTFYGNLYTDIEKFERIKILDNRDSNIFIVEESYKIPTLWKKNKPEDNITYCEFYPQSLETYFSVSKSSQRTAPYRLSFPLSYAHEIHVNMPEEWSIANDNSTIETEFYDYKYKVSNEDKHVLISTQYRTKAPFIPVEAFSKFVEDHEKMMGNLTYRVTYDNTVSNAKVNKWPGIAVSIIAIIIGICLTLWLYHRYNPQPYYPAAWGQPIGGWLVLVGIGLSVTPIVIISGFITNYDVVNGDAWMMMLYTKNYSIFFFLLFEHIYNIVYLLFAVLVLLLFFQRRSSVPKLISIFYGASCIVTILDNIVALQIDSSTVIDSKEMIRGVIAAAIWIPYFQMSQRVKKTFVNIHNDNNQDMIPEPVAVQDASVFKGDV